MVYLLKRNYRYRALDKHKIYTNMLVVGLENILKNKDDDSFHILISRRETNKNLNKILTSRLLENDKHNTSVDIRTPDQEKCLQAIDVISWSLFRKYERSDLSYFELFKNIVKAEYPYI
jgi:hypothetical protein